MSLITRMNRSTVIAVFSGPILFFFLSFEMLKEFGGLDVKPCVENVFHIWVEIAFVLKISLKFSSRKISSTDLVDFTAEFAAPSSKDTKVLKSSFGFIFLRNQLMDLSLNNSAP